MDAVFKLKPEELTQTFFAQLQQFASLANYVEIRLDDTEMINGLSKQQIEKRLYDLSEHKTISFTMEELETYIHKLAD